jgi:hypothetical protein
MYAIYTQYVNNVSFQEFQYVKKEAEVRAHVEEVHQARSLSETSSSSDSNFTIGFRKAPNESNDTFGLGHSGDVDDQDIREETFREGLIENSAVENLNLRRGISKELAAAEDNTPADRFALVVTSPSRYDQSGNSSSESEDCGSLFEIQNNETTMNITVNLWDTLGLVIDDDADVQSPEAMVDSDDEASTPEFQRKSVSAERNTFASSPFENGPRATWDNAGLVSSPLTTISPIFALGTSTSRFTWSQTSQSEQDVGHHLVPSSSSGIYHRLGSNPNLDTLSPEANSSFCRIPEKRRKSQADMSDHMTFSRTWDVNDVDESEGATPGKGARLSSHASARVGIPATEPDQIRLSSRTWNSADHQNAAINIGKRKTAARANSGGSERNLDQFQDFFNGAPQVTQQQESDSSDSDEDAKFFLVINVNYSKFMQVPKI